MRSGLVDQCLSVGPGEYTARPLLSAIPDAVSGRARFGDEAQWNPQSPHGNHAVPLPWQWRIQHKPDRRLAVPSAAAALVASPEAWEKFVAARSASPEGRP